MFFNRTGVCSPSEFENKVSLTRNRRSFRRWLTVCSAVFAISYSTMAQAAPGNLNWADDPLDPLDDVDTATIGNGGTFPTIQTFTLDEGYDVTLTYSRIGAPAAHGDGYIQTRGTEFGGVSDGHFHMGMTASAADLSQCVQTRFQFEVALTGFTVPLLDIDLGPVNPGPSTWADGVLVHALNAGSDVAPASVTIESGTPTVVERTTADSECNTLVNTHAAGSTAATCLFGTTRNATNDSNDGNVTLVYANPIDEFVFTYCNANIAGSFESQRIGIHNLRWLDTIELGSYVENTAGTSSYVTIDNVYYRDPNSTGMTGPDSTNSSGQVSETDFYVGGRGFLPNTSYDVAYYDENGDFVFNDTDAAADGSGILDSAYTSSDTLDTQDQTFGYGNWTAVVLDDGVVPAATYAAQQAAGNTIIEDNFETRSWSRTIFTESDGTELGSNTYDVTSGSSLAYVSVTDQDENQDPLVSECITATVSDTTTGDSVGDIDFCESPSSTDSGEFAFLPDGNRVPITISTCDGGDPGSNTLCIVPMSSSLVASYSDNDDVVDVSSGNAATNPVTLSYIKTRQVGQRIKFVWGTTTETFNFGFNLWGEVDGTWHRLNKRVVTSRGTDSLKPKNYSKKVSVANLPGDVSRIGISSVDLSGHEDFYGPYEIGRKFGNDVEFEPIPWDDIVVKASDSMRALGYEQRGRNWVRERSGNSGLDDSNNMLRSTVAEFKSEEVGIYRVTHDQLMAIGVDLRGISKSEIALTRGGEAVVRRIRARKGKWDAGSYVEWLAQGVSEEEALHTLEEVHRLVLDNTKVRNVGKIKRKTRNASTHHAQQLHVNKQAYYDFTMPKPDPWYQAYITDRNVTGDANMIVSVHNAELTNSSKFTVRLITLTNFIAGTDHKVEVVHIGHDDAGGEVETALGQGESDGYGVLEYSVDVPAGVLRDGDNVFRVKVLPVLDDNGEVPSGYWGSAMYLDRYSLSFTQQGVVRDSEISFQGEDAAHTLADGYVLNGFESKNIVAYASADDNLSRIAVRSKRAADGSYSAIVPEVSSGVATYYVSTVAELKQPMIGRPASVTEDSLAIGNADYLVISHPVFMDRLLNPQEGEQDFIAAKQAMGYTVKIVNVEDIMQAYGSGMHLPEAIQSYLGESKFQNDALRHVLLVGYASRDPHDYLGSGSWNFIPTMYAETYAFLNFAPSDSLIADIDGDHLQDISLGRWSVRTIEDLDTVINKTLTYQDLISSNAERTGLLAADAFDGNNFAAQMNRIGQQMVSPADVYGDADVSWDITRVFKDVDGIQANRNVVNALNEGPTVAAYSGHGSPTLWSYNGMLAQFQVSHLTNSDRPSLILPMTCYTTYFVSDSMDTLGNQFLTGTTGGAAALYGASTLSGFGDNEQMATRVLDYMLNGQNEGQPLTLGEAIVAAKHDVGLRFSTRASIVSGNLMGDPSISLVP